MRYPLRRIVAVILVTAALALGVVVPALADHSIAVAYTGPVTPGSELTLSCPEGYTLGTGEADFYRDPRMRVPVALNVNPTGYTYSPEGDRTVSAFWIVPQGARYADASVQCFQVTPPPTMTTGESTTTTATTRVPTTSTTTVPTTQTTTVPTTSTTTAP